jgi:hypothetical protein
MIDRSVVEKIDIVSKKDKNINISLMREKTKTKVLSLRAALIVYIREE